MLFYCRIRLIQCISSQSCSPCRAILPAFSRSRSATLYQSLGTPVRKPIIPVLHRLHQPDPIHREIDMYTARQTDSGCKRILITSNEEVRKQGVDGCTVLGHLERRTVSFPKFQAERGEHSHIEQG